LTCVLAQELWRFNISINEPIPGLVITEMTQASQYKRVDTVFAIDRKWGKHPADVVLLAPAGEVHEFWVAQRVAAW
jgi:3-oxoacyl-[acyl-carrier protein] reductase